MNVSRLNDSDIKWADYVFVSAMIAQQKSTREVVNRCKKLNKKVVGGGPLFTTGHKEFDFNDIDHMVLNEAEITLPHFLEDLKNGCPKHIYQTDQRADITKTPTPLFSLLNLKNYVSVTIQYSRGCPYDCEFCDIVILDGHKPRTKTRDQIISELDAVFKSGYRGSIFVVDDNFIGNKKKLKTDILPAITQWQEKKQFPFTFLTEVSVNLADDEELMQLMSNTGFNNVFVGIETPNEASLSECNKFANKHRNLVTSVKKLQNYGFQVMGGFIVGFDSDPISIFKSQITFIQKSGIVTAMVGLLMAPPETKLWHRMKKENRLLPGGTGDNTDGTTNLVPKMNLDVLVNGYKQILHTIYSPKQYYERILTFVREYRPSKKATSKIKIEAYHIKTLFKATFMLGIRDRSSYHYWRLIFLTFLKYPRHIGLCITLAIQGFHFRKVYDKVKEIQVDNAFILKQQKILCGKQI